MWIYLLRPYIMEAHQDLLYAYCNRSESAAGGNDWCSKMGVRLRWCVLMLNSRVTVHSFYIAVSATPTVLCTHPLGHNKLCSVNMKSYQIYCYLPAVCCYMWQVKTTLLQYNNKLQMPYYHFCNFIYIYILYSLSLCIASYSRL